MDKKDRLTDAKVGLFVLMAVVILVVGTLWIAGGPMFSAKGVSYRIALQDSGGIKAGDRVRFAGVNVGRVQQVELDPEADRPVVFHVTVKPDIPVRTDSSARITTAGLLGSAFLQIEPGTATASLLPPGGEIRGESGMGLEETLKRVDEVSGQVVGLMDRTAGILDQISTEVGPILEQMHELVGDRNVQDVRHILATLRSTVDDASPRLSELMAGLESISTQLDEGLEEVPDLFQQMEALLADVQSALGDDGTRLARLLESADDSLESADELLKMFSGNREELDATLLDLRDTVANLKAFSQAVKERPFSLVRVKPESPRRPGDGVKEGTP